jgi:hypothetical protein
LVCWAVPQAEDRATQGCDPSVAWGPRADGPVLLGGAGLFCRSWPVSSFISLWPNCGKPDLAAMHVGVWKKPIIPSCWGSGLSAARNRPQPPTRHNMGMRPGRSNYERVWPTACGRWRTIGCRDWSGRKVVSVVSPWLPGSAGEVAFVVLSCFRDFGCEVVCAVLPCLRDFGCGLGGVVLPWLRGSGVRGVSAVLSRSGVGPAAGFSVGVAGRGGDVSAQGFLIPGRAGGVSVYGWPFVQTT